GYLGSLLWGVTIYCASIKSFYDKTLTASLGVSVILMTVFMSSDSFSWFFGLGSGVIMLLFARYLPNKYNDFFLRLLALTNMLYVPLDIYSDTISRSHLRSDAYMLAEEIGGSTVFWGGLWLVISLIVIFYCLKWSLNQKKIALKN
ncbi:MAG: M50 family metallopeptidase, partial [Methylococcales bacterium]|nr:M50 family metallopeptidase [Methylococcales bacterium]